MTKIECVWREPALHGEGPLWVERENAVYWVDIGGRKVHRYGLAEGSRKTWAFDTEVTSLAARERGGFVCTVRDGFAFIDFESGRIDPVALPEAGIPGNRFNDGKVDPRGRYWGGSTDCGFTLETAALYRLDPDLAAYKMDEGYICNNGPAFSADGRTMYHTETIRRTIYAFDLGEDGGIRNKRVFLELKGEDEGLPDGMTVDSENCLWLCHFAGGRITRFSPGGEVLRVVPMPVPNVTSCTFAGSELDTLYVTTSPFGLSDEDLRKHPLSGSLFAFRPGVKGLPTPLFAG